MLNQIDAVGLQPLQRRVDLLRRFLERPAIDLRHEKDLLAQAAAERLPHANFAGAFVVIPAVVEKVDAAIDGSPNDPDAERLIDMLERQMPSAKADRRHALAGLP